MSAFKYFVAALVALAAVFLYSGYEETSDLERRSPIPLSNKGLKMATGLQMPRLKKSLVKRSSRKLAIAGEQQARTSGANSLPSYFNLADQGYITSVKDQGWCGSCTAFAGVAAIEGSILKQTNHTINTTALDYSEASFFYCATRATDTIANCDMGAYSWTVAAALEHIGVQRESQYRYTVTFPGCIPQHDYENLEFTSHMLGTPLELRQWLQTNGPVYAAIQIPADFYSRISPKNNFTYDASDDLIHDYGGMLAGLHAVTIVGYDWDYVSPNTGLHGRWLAKNSWSKDWGDNGYFKIAVGQLGSVSGMFGETIGFKVKPREDNLCIYGTMRPDPEIANKTIDLCDAVRVGHTKLPDSEAAIAFYDLALSVTGKGIEPFVDCSRRTDFSKLLPAYYSTLAYRGMRIFGNKHGILEPLIYAGCRRKPLSVFRLKSGTRCADALVVNSATWLPKGIRLIGYEVPDTVADSVYCTHRTSIFTLNHDGTFYFQNRAVGEFVNGNTRYVTLVPSSPLRYELSGQRVKVRGRDHCIGIVGDRLTFMPCAQVSGSRLPTFSAVNFTSI